MKFILFSLCAILAIAPSAQAGYTRVVSKRGAVTSSFTIETGSSRVPDLVCGFSTAVASAAFINSLLQYKRLTYLRDYKDKTSPSALSAKAVFSDLTISNSENGRCVAFGAVPAGGLDVNPIVELENEKRRVKSFLGVSLGVGVSATITALVSLFWHKIS